MQILLNTENQEIVASAIANAKAARRGAPAMSCILNVLPNEMRIEVMDDAKCALEALDEHFQ